MFLKPGSRFWREDVPQPLRDEAGDTGTRVAMVLAVMS
jgi:hypothetical protein